MVNNTNNHNNINEKREESGENDVDMKKPHLIGLEGFAEMPKCSNSDFSDVI